MFLLPALILAGLQAATYATQIARAGVVTERGIYGALGLVGFATGLVAIASFGMWMGLTSRKTNLAVIKTLVFVKVFPWLALSFLRITLTIVLFSSSALRGAIPSLTWLPAVITGILGIGLDLFFILLARRKVLDGFRAFVSQSSEGIVRPALPPPSPAVAEGASQPLVTP
jgi:hypothetical protein